MEKETRYYWAFSQLYALLSASLRRPSIELAKSILDGSYAQALGDLMKPMDEPAIKDALKRVRSFVAQVADYLPRNLRLELEVEFNRLFVGPDTVPVAPYESWFVNQVNGERRLMCDAAFEVRRSYQEAGFVLDNGYRDLPDHMATELRFVSELTKRMAQSPDSIVQDETRLALFLENHLKLWAQDFANGVSQHSRCAYYQGVAALTATVVELS